MGRFHINKHGVPAPCKAEKGNCPLGEGPGSHFSSKIEAEVASERTFEEKYGVISVIEGASADNAHEATLLKEELKNIVYEDENPTSGSLGYGRKIDENYIMNLKNPDGFRDISTQEVDNVEGQMKKDYLKKVELVDNIIHQSSKYESMYNNNLEEIVKKDIEIVREEKVEEYSNRKLLSRIRAGLSAAFGNNGGEMSNEISEDVGRKESVVEKRTETSKGKMRDEEVIENSIAAGKNIETEIAKEEAMKIYVDPSVDMIKRLNERTSERINNDLKSKVSMIRNPEMKEKALSYLEDLNNIQNRNYISDLGRKRVIAKFNRANEGGKKEDLVGCNRLVDMIEAKDRDINTYLASDINEITFKENYQRIKDGNVFATNSQEEVNEEIKSITENLISCFEY